MQAQPSGAKDSLPGAFGPLHWGRNGVSVVAIHPQQVHLEGPGTFVQRDAPSRVAPSRAVERGLGPSAIQRKDPIKRSQGSSPVRKAWSQSWTACAFYAIPAPFPRKSSDTSH
jgi:hypothetical protein